MVEASKYPARVEELSRALGAQPSAVEAMLETLVRRGRVIAIAIDSAGSICAECALRGRCDRPVQQGKCYLLLSTPQADTDSP